MEHIVYITHNWAFPELENTWKAANLSQNTALEGQGSGHSRPTLSNSGVSHNANYICHF